MVTSKHCMWRYIRNQIVAKESIGVHPVIAEPIYNTRCYRSNPFAKPRVSNKTSDITKGDIVVTRLGV